MTEEEAKTKWCPDRAKAAAARGHDPFGVDADCLVSGCAMWRWESGKIDTQGKLTGDRVIKKTGYCGLGGK